MLPANKPFYTYCFGSLGEALETALATDFFRWFHLKETERRPQEPGEALRFRPSGEKFHDLCCLDVLAAPHGELVRMELAVLRAFLDGADHLFAQDLVKSFLLAALPGACQYLLADFVREIEVPGGKGRTPGFLVFRGQQSSWEKLTGWSHLLLVNLPLREGASLVVQVSANPKAPNAKLIGVKGSAKDDHTPWAKGGS